MKQHRNQSALLNGCSGKTIDDVLMSIVFKQSIKKNNVYW